MPSSSSSSSSSFWTPYIIFPAAILLRLTLLLYGLFQDAHSPLKYTDIDYFVFTDAARYVSVGESPYQRETYRYTPLLAWLLLPTTWTSSSAKEAGSSWFWFSFGKVLFSIADVVAGWLIVRVLRSQSSSSSSLSSSSLTRSEGEGGMEIPPQISPEKSLKLASIWLLNPLVATISTRGSSEGLLCVMVVALLWAVLQRRIKLAGILLGLAVHFKIYPFIYGTSIFWHLETPSPSSPDDDQKPTSTTTTPTLATRLRTFLNPSRISLLLTSLLTFSALNYLMYTIYGHPFLQQTYLHHLTRIDHRHNFSPYNTLLYISSSNPNPTTTKITPESLAFIPQLLLSALLIPLALAKRNLPCTLLIQTWTFVTFNKVCTSQYFLWYLIFLPFYLGLPRSRSRSTSSFLALLLWILPQAVWLQQAYTLEFLGRSTFVGLWGSSLVFFVVNCWMLGVVIEDVGMGGHGRVRRGRGSKKDG